MSNKIKLTFADPIAPEYRWFAWYPVYTADRGMRWFSFVFKRKYGLHSYLSIPMGNFFMYSVEKGILS